MMPSSWHSHCESSPSSFDKCRLSAEVAANPQTKPTDLDCESARKKWQLPSRLAIVFSCYFLCHKVDLLWLIALLYTTRRLNFDEK